MPQSVKITQFYLLLAAAAYLSLTPQAPAVMAHVSDKLLHAAGYCGLIASAHLAHAPNRQHLLKIAGLLAYSVGIEFAQSFVPGRSCSLGDMAANLTGLLVGALFVRLAYRALSGPGTAPAKTS